MAGLARALGGPNVDALYNLMQSFENKLGGGEGVEGLYGSITQSSMQKVLDCMKHNSGLDSRSVFVDIGAGLGRPILHAMVSAGVKSAWGVELDHVKCDKAAAFCQHVLANLVNQDVMEASVAVPQVVCSPIEKVNSLDPATHAYSFWEGVPPSGKEAFGKLFARSKTLRAVAVVQRAIRGQDPAALMRELGFGPLLLIQNFPVKMSGSGRSFTAYVFTKIAPAAANFIATATTPGRGLTLAVAHQDTDDSDEEEEQTRTVPLVSPSKTRKPDMEPGPASPLKKVAVREGTAADGTEKVEVGDRVVPNPVVAVVRPKATHQVLLTTLPEYSRRTKQSAAVTGKVGGKQATAGKGAATAADKAPPTGKVPKGRVAKGKDAKPDPVVPTLGTRTSSRLAAKVAAAAIAAALEVELEGC